MTNLFTTSKNAKRSRKSKRNLKATPKQGIIPKLAAIEVEVESVIRQIVLVLLKNLSNRNPLRREVDHTLHLTKKDRFQ